MTFVHLPIGLSIRRIQYKGTAVDTAQFCKDGETQVVHFTDGVGVDDVAVQCACRPREKRKLETIVSFAAWNVDAGDSLGRTHVDDSVFDERRMLMIMSKLLSRVRSLQSATWRMTSSYFVVGEALKIS